MADDLERRRSPLQPNGGRHVSALEMLAESSSTRSVPLELDEFELQTEAGNLVSVCSARSDGTATDRGGQKAQASAPSAAQRDVDHSSTDLERVRAKLKAARERMSGPYAEIPTGRVYDTPPDASDEQVYDTLEKAYNAAFWVAPPESKEHPLNADRMIQDDRDRSATVAKGEEVKQVVKDEASARKSINDGESVQKVGTLKSICLSTLKQHSEINEKVEPRHSKAQDDIVKEKLEPSSSENMPTRSTAPAAGAMAPASISAESVGTTVSPPQSPMPSEDDVQSMETDSSHIPLEPEKARAERPDHLSLNEFLISELKVYCSRVLEQRSPKGGSSGASDLARVTAFQLYQDHRRNLMDFDDEWKRSHADSYRGFAEETPTGAPRGNITCNPFQEVTPGLEGTDEWTTLLQRVKPSNPKTNHSAVVNAPSIGSIHGYGDLIAAHKRGSNGVIVGCDNERQQIGAFMAQIPEIQNTPALHVVVSASSDLVQWQKALSSHQLIQLYPYWGNKEDRQNLLQLLSNEYFCSHNLSAHVLLTSYEVFMEDIAILTSLQCQLSIIDVPDVSTNKITAMWPHLLSLRCRQRLLLCRTTFEIDARMLLHFIVPELFGSRRKLLAWNSAAFHPEQVREICDVMKDFILISTFESSSALIKKAESCTRKKCERERDVLEMLNKQGAVRAVEPSIKVSMRRLLKKKPRNIGSGHIPVKASRKVFADPEDPELSISAPQILPQKRSGSDGSRQRVGRCGKCAGCLKEDCMKCGHCQDMKKYGGPGLRKQSCKNRKCLNPKLWGLSSRKRKRSRAKRPDDQVGGSEVDDYSAESDAVSTSTFGYGDGSDSESVRFSDATMDSPRDLLLPASDTLGDKLSLSDMSSQSTSARKRVMRCGECAGCRAPDCMKCRYCVDMKKYGGPGLRKQSCKDRKCIAPKIVMLNQSKDNQYVDEKGNVVYSEQSGDTFPGFYEAPDALGRPEEIGTVKVTPDKRSGSHMLSVVRECEVFVKPRLIFSCKKCVARFSSKPLLDFHTRVEHLTDRNVVPQTALELEASKLFKQAICQNAILTVQLKQEGGGGPHSSPLGYAKLEGQDFQYYLIEPFVVLGRMDYRWRELYKGLGFRDLKGLAGGDVDCHVGNDSMIGSVHAVISWDAHGGTFVIECLSSRVPISVNGQAVSFSSPPMVLRSRNLLQIGASVFYFLLPTSIEANSSSSSKPSQEAKTS